MEAAISISRQGKSNSEDQGCSLNNALYPSRFSFLFAGFVLKWTTDWPSAAPGLYPVGLATPTERESSFPTVVAEVPGGGAGACVQAGIRCLLLKPVGGVGPT